MRSREHTPGMKKHIKKIFKEDEISGELKKTKIEKNKTNEK
jgi:hypothetical protein